jgi:hypothetical protein
VRKPWATLRGVQPEPLETTLQPAGEGRRLPTRIGEDEHADGACLAVAHGLEVERIRRSSLLAESTEYAFERAARPSAQERERDVEALDEARRILPCAEVLLDPANELRDDVVGKHEREEEPETVIFLDGSRSAHVGV